MIEFKNESDKDTIRFRLQKSEYEVPPGKVVQVPDNLAYAVELMQVRVKRVTPEKQDAAKPDPGKAANGSKGADDTKNG